MKGRRTVTVLLGAIALIFAGITAANAGQIRPYTCYGGDIGSGTYASLTVKGNCKVPDNAHVTVLGNVTVRPHASLFASTLGSTLRIHGNVVAGRGSSLSLGCTPAHPCDNPTGEEGKGAPGPQPPPYLDSVGGNVVLDHVFNAALNGVWIGGNLTSWGGGAPADRHQSFSIKDDTIRGNVVVIGVSTDWFGVIRSQIGGNVTLIGNRGARLSPEGQPDSNEVVANTIGGNLACFGNTPTARFGDALQDGPPGYGPNAVGGVAVGECAQLTHR